MGSLSHSSDDVDVDGNITTNTEVILQCIRFSLEHTAHDEKDTNRIVACKIRQLLKSEKQIRAKRPCELESICTLKERPTAETIR